jgi:membrane-associated protein
MNHPAARWKKSALRLLAVALLLAAFAGLGISPAFAAEGEPAGAEASNFWVELLATLFNSRGLMELLGRPEYAALAFLALNLIVFTETGLLVGFCLPGDSLLVTAGLIASNPACDWNLPLLLVTLSASAIVGDTVGYAIGLKTGPKIFCREKSIFFNKEHLLKAQQFYERYGAETIILARFIPILRTFAPVVAGVGRMEYRRFLSYNVFGGVGWVFSMVLVGYFLPSVINPVLQPLLGPDFLVQDHVEKVVILVVVASVSPGIFAWLRSKVAGKPRPKPELADATNVP